MSAAGVTAPIDPDVISSMSGRSLLLTTDWTIAELENLFAIAARFQHADRAGTDTAFLPNELAYALFFDNSTRTKSAWAGAATRLGMRPVIVDGSSTQVQHGETAEETGAMLGMNSHALGIRHDMIIGEGQLFMQDVKRGIDDYLKATEDPRRVPIVNLQCDVDHPTQTLADFMWLREHLGGDVAGRRVAVSWAYSPSYAKPLSVPQGLITLLSRFGANVVLAHPKGYGLLEDRVAAAEKSAQGSGGRLTFTDSMDEAFEGADIVYPKSWGPYDLMMERVSANREGSRPRMDQIEKEALSRNAGNRDWICDERRMAMTAQGKALYMHCLPADIGDEVSTGVAEGARIDLARQANKKMYVIMALLAVAKVRDLTARLEGVSS